MEENLFTGHWKGYYKYGERYSKHLQKIENYFEMELVVIKNKITGLCKDEDTKDLFEESADIFGNIGNDYSLDFTKHYPFFYGTDDDGDIFIDKSMKHPPVDYFGIFDPITNTAFGNWRMELIQVTDIETVLRHEFDGTWLMKKL